MCISVLRVLALVLVMSLGLSACGESEHERLQRNADQMEREMREEADRARRRQREDEARWRASKVGGGTPAQLLPGRNRTGLGGLLPDEVIERPERESAEPTSDPNEMADETDER